MTSICEVAVIERVRISLNSTSTISFGSGWNPMDLQLWDSSGSPLGIVRDLLYAKWNASELPTAPGSHQNVSFVENPVYIYFMDSTVETEVFAHLDIGAMRYLGDLTDNQIAMMSGTGPMVEMPEIEADWRLLTPDELPSVEFSFSAVTTY